MNPKGFIHSKAVWSIKHVKIEKDAKCKHKTSCTFLYGLNLPNTQG